VTLGNSVPFSEIWLFFGQAARIVSGRVAPFFGNLFPSLFPIFVVLSDALPSPLARTPCSLDARRLAAPLWDL